MQYLINAFDYVVLLILNTLGYKYITKPILKSELNDFEILLVRIFVLHILVILTIIYILYKELV